MKRKWIFFIRTKRNMTKEMIKGMEKVYGESERTVIGREKLSKFMTLLKRNGIRLFEYNINTDHITIYEEEEVGKKQSHSFFLI